MAKETDKKVLDLIKLAKAKKDAIKKIDKSSYKTNCSFGFDPTGTSRINLHVTTDLSLLLTIHGYLSSIAKGFSEVDERLGTFTPFVWMGYSFRDWQADVETRIQKLQVTKEKSELEKLEARLDKLISPEMRAEIELQEIESMLS